MALPHTHTHTWLSEIAFPESWYAACMHCVSAPEAINN